MCLQYYVKHAQRLVELKQSNAHVLKKVFTVFMLVNVLSPFTKIIEGILSHGLYLNI